MRPIRLPIYHLTDEQSSLSELDIEIDTEDCVLKEITFYVINCVGTRSKNPEEALIYSNGEQFICSLSKAEVEHVIYKTHINEK